MFRILGLLEVYGSKCGIEKLAEIAKLENGIIRQVGLKRKIPDADHWSYSTPLFRFRIESIDSEISDFLMANNTLGKALAIANGSVDFAFLTIIPVEQSFEESLSIYLATNTIKAIASSNLGFQVSPASVMPDAPYWRE